MVEERDPGSLIAVEKVHLLGTGKKRAEDCAVPPGEIVTSGPRKSV